MIFTEFNLKQALNKAFLKQHIGSDKINLLAQCLRDTAQKINIHESEAYHKNLIRDFLNKVYYDPNFTINTKDYNDLVIYNGNMPTSSIGVIIETKRPAEKYDMVSSNSMNTKALHELILYFLRERITNKNLELKHLIITNLYHWFIFDACDFETIFVQNKNMVHLYQSFESKQLSGTKTEYFYKEIAENFVTNNPAELKFTVLDFQNFINLIPQNAEDYESQLTLLYKILSPEHLLKLPFANDSNSLNTAFYHELLHIIGLAEITDKGKSLIQRLPAKHRNSGSFIENTMSQLDSLDKLSRFPNLKAYGDTTDEQLFNIALELSITWINRILFLKLLEAQLMVYHKHSTKSYRFLHLDSIGDFNALNNLFFQILARKSSDRALDLQEKFNHIPYLNSSLFEPTDIEQLGIFVHNLDNQKSLSIYSATVLKNKQGVKKSGQIASLHYLFEFLNAYDFGGETMDNNLQESPKTLINAAVLGLIFEKINGYKDGSFFTPGFITMFVCRETIRHGVLQKFNEGFPSLKLKHFDDIYNLIPRTITKAKANELVNSLKICDPAVGSGHFLVSALNELIAVKNDLQILEDKNGKSLHRYDVEVVHDELLITDENGDIFEYIPFHKESQRLQEALFREKQTLIERCLFGVDINANSVKICRLRLWIELLKSAYYKNATELETLPNIDINIKCGNSLVSRFALNADLKQALKKSTWTIASYKQAIETYHNAQNKEQKREMETLILHIKQSFTTEIRMNDPLKNRLDKLANELYQRFTGKYLFDSEHAYETNNKANEIKRQREQAQLEYEIKNLNAKIDDIKSNKIYDQAFEWRFEFPEVLNDEGDFEGFDIIIGNPPYIQLQSLKDVADQLQQGHYETYSRTGDIYSLFYEKGNMLLKKGGFLGFITSNKWLRAGYGKATRNYLLKHTQPILLVDLGSGVFDEATVDSNILIFKKETCSKLFAAIDFSKQKNIQKIMLDAKDIVEILPKLDENWTINNALGLSIKNKVERLGKPLKEWDITINYGIKTGFNEAFIITGAKRAELIAADPKSAEIIKPILRGRDIKRYKAEFADLWLINSHNGLKNKNLTRIHVEKDYPVIYKHLQQYENELKTRQDQGDHWTNLRNCAYFDEFQKEKIVWPETTLLNSFYLDNMNFYCEKTSFFMTSKHNKFLMSILNSKFFLFSYRALFSSVTLGEKGFQINKHAFINYPIPSLKLPKQKPFISLVDKILDKKARNEDTTTLEKEIDMLVYKLYELTPEEIQYIENQ